MGSTFGEWLKNLIAVTAVRPVDLAHSMGGTVQNLSGMYNDVDARPRAKSVKRLFEMLGFETFEEFDKAWRAGVFCKVDGAIFRERVEQGARDYLRRLSYSNADEVQKVMLWLRNMPEHEVESALRLVDEKTAFDVGRMLLNWVSELQRERADGE